MNVQLMRPNIALCSSSFRAGKDTLGQYLVDRYRYKRFAFADSMKRAAHQVFDDIPTSPKPRGLYQFFGEAMREYDSHVWIRKLEAEARHYRNLCPIVITDLRLPVEYDWARSHGYKIVRVVCPEHIRLARTTAAGDSFDSATFVHNTEAHADGFDVDWEIVNDGTLDELYISVDAMMTELVEVDASVVR